MLEAHRSCVRGPLEGSRLFVYLTRTIRYDAAHALCGRRAVDLGQRPTLSDAFVSLATYLLSALVSALVVVVGQGGVYLGKR